MEVLLPDQHCKELNDGLSRAIDRIEQQLLAVSDGRLLFDLDDLQIQRDALAYRIFYSQGLGDGIAVSRLVRLISESGSLFTPVLNTSEIKIHFNYNDRKSPFAVFGKNWRHSKPKSPSNKCLSELFGRSLSLYPLILSLRKDCLMLHYRKLGLHHPNLVLHQSIMSLHQRMLVLHRVNLSLHRRTLMLYHSNLMLHHPILGLHYIIMVLHRLSLSLHHQRW